MTKPYKRQDDLTGLRNTFNLGAIGLGAVGAMYLGQMYLGDANVQDLIKGVAWPWAAIALGLMIAPAIIIKTQGLTIFPEREPKP